MSRKLAILLCALASVAGLPAASAQESQAVQFARGTSSIVLTGTVRGYQYRDYVVNARAGQRLSVSLRTRHGATYFNVTPPGSQSAIHIGSAAGNDFAGPLPRSGPTTIRVYMMRSAARRNEVANYRLSIAVTGAAAQLPGEPVSPAPGGPSATAAIPCAQAMGQPMRPCQAAVYRGRAGIARMVVDMGGARRTINWANGRPVSSDSRLPVRSTRNGDLTTISIGRERFEVPDAFVFGG